MRSSIWRVLRTALTGSLFFGGVTVAFIGAGPAQLSATGAAEPYVDATTSWTVYHGDALGTGADPSGVTFSPPNHAWTSPVLDGQIYGEPLEATGRVYVATENDTVYALAANTGAVLWMNHVGPPVQQGELNCSGDIGPTVGITGTPVIDVNRGEIYAVVDENIGGTPHHFLVGMNIYSGVSMMAEQPVDPPGQDPAAILQRTGLNLSDGNVVFGYGGQDGDCPTYSGWIGSVPEGGGTPGFYQAVPIGNDGAVWMGGAAPEVDASGNIWFATGNGSGSTPYDNSDSVIELTPGLARTQLFAPTTWQTDNQNDRDLGSSPPALLSNGTALQIGKSSTAYLLNQSDLGGISNPPQISACGSDSDGGHAISGTVVYVPCGGGVQEIQTSPLNAQWQNGNASGPPILAGGLVWSIGGSTLYGLDPGTGTKVEQVSLGDQPANHFPTPSVGDGLLLAPSYDQVVAFYGSAGIPEPPTSPPPGSPGGTLTLKKTTSLIGNYPEQVWGTGWHADTAVTLNECASTTYSPATCDAANQKAVTLGTGNLAGTFKGQVIDLAAGVIDTNGDKCGVAGATTCYVVVVGNSGDSTASVTLGFTLPTLSIHKSTLVLGNYVNAVKVGGIPIGDSVLAVECDVSVSVPAATVSASNCDDATEIFGTSAANGKVVFTSAGVPMKVNGAYSDGASGACLTGGTCTILVQDFSNASFDATVAVAFATPTLSVHTITNALGNYVDAVKAAGFPIGDTVDATECDSGVTVPNPAAAHCDGATQISGPVGTNGRVTFTALGVPLAVGGAFSDAAAGTCPAGGTCEIVANDAGNTGVGLDEAVTFASPTATLHESTNIPANFVDNVGAASFPIGNTVTATECDTTVTPANQGTNCDSSTQITGTVATNGKVIFSPSGIKMLSSSSYTDGAAGAPGNVVVNDSTHSGFYIAIPVTMAG